MDKNNKGIHVTRTTGRRSPRGIRPLGQALIALAQAQLEAEAQAQAEAKVEPTQSQPPTRRQPSDQTNHRTGDAA